MNCIRAASRCTQRSGEEDETFPDACGADRAERFVVTRRGGVAHTRLAVPWEERLARRVRSIGQIREPAPGEVVEADSHGLGLVPSICKLSVSGPETGLG